MAWAKVTSLAEGLGSGGGTTSQLDTTGADIIFISVACDGGSSPTPTDNKGNTYTLAETHTTGSTRLRLFYCHNPNVGASHEWEVAAGSGFISCVVHAWSGSHATASEDENNDNGATGTSTTTGSITPTDDGALLITGLALDPAGGTSTSINESFTKDGEVAPSPGNYYGSVFAYKVQVSAAAINPTWSWSGSTDAAAAIVAFLPAAGGGGGAPVLLIRQLRD